MNIDYIKGWFANLTLKKAMILLMAAMILAALAHSVFAHDEDECSCNQPPTSGDLACLDGAFDGPTGDLKMLRIPIDWPGRMTVGDVDNDGIPDVVVARRDALAAYNVCGEKLWQKANRTNWTNTIDDGTPGHDVGHPYHLWSSFGWIGDPVGDGRNRYLNIAEDRRTLIIRDAATGNVEVGFDLGTPAEWHYVTIGEVGGSPRVFVSAKPGRLLVQSLDLRGGLNVDWKRDYNYRLTHYIPPAVGDINADGHDDLYLGSAAVDGRSGALLWRHGFGQYGIGGAHTGSLRDVDPNTPGLESVVTVYSPKSKGQPSLVIVDSQGNMRKTFNDGRHGHQHTVGDFQPARPGLETFVRDHNGKSHYLVDKNGRIVARNVRLNPRTLNNRWGSEWGDDAGELILSIDWDGGGDEELLYIERHVNFRNVPMIAIAKNKFLTRAFHGGIDVRRTDPNPMGWIGPIKSGHERDGIYEGFGHAVDMIGDGREEVVAMAHNQIVIYFNSGDAGVPKRWGPHEYETRKKIWGNVYGPR